MDFEKFQEKLGKWHKGQRTLLSVGATSLNVISSTIHVANSIKVPLQLAASRRQVEWDGLSQGYTDIATDILSQYVRKNDEANCVHICRNHGGPWQGIDEEKLSHKRAMESAKQSYKADVENGFDIIHIDPCLNAKNKDRTLANIKADITELIDYCEGLGRNDLVYECSLEEFDGTSTDLDELRKHVVFLKNLSPKIKFIAAKTGTLAKETQNIGKYNKQRARDIVEICNDNGLLLKEHGLDYAEKIVLQDHKLAGIHAVNITPEFAVIETKKLLELLTKYKLRNEKNRFVALAVSSKRWKKWAVSDLKPLQKAEIAGHYVYAIDEVCNIREKLNKQMNGELDLVLQNYISQNILKYLKEFVWIV